MNYDTKFKESINDFVPLPSSEIDHKGCALSLKGERLLVQTLAPESDEVTTKHWVRETETTPMPQSSCEGIFDMLVSGGSGEATRQVWQRASRRDRCSRSETNRSQEHYTAPQEAKQELPT